MNIVRLAKQQDISAAPPSAPSIGDGSTSTSNLMLDKEVQALMQLMVDQGTYALVPIVGEKGINFPGLSTIFPNRTEEERVSFLEKLANGGILKVKLLDKIIACPTCGGLAIYSKYNCPRCSSFDIGKASIIEHIRCGYIGSKEKFQKAAALVCPNCKSGVGETDYKKIGTSFVCNSCGSRFEAPKISHKCNSCNDVFTYKEARYEGIYQYELADEAKRNIAQGTLPLASMVSCLRERGFDVGLKKDLVGKSGATHTFDVTARRTSDLIVANFTFEPKEEDIIGLFAKKYDIEPTHTLLVALTPPSKEEQAVARAYGVNILFSGGRQTMAQQIAELLA